MCERLFILFLLVLVAFFSSLVVDYQQNTSLSGSAPAEAREGSASEYGRMEAVGLPMPTPINPKSLLCNPYC